MAACVALAPPTATRTGAVVIAGFASRDDAVTADRHTDGRSSRARPPRLDLTARTATISVRLVSVVAGLAGREDAVPALGCRWVGARVVVGDAALMGHAAVALVDAAVVFELRRPGRRRRSSAVGTPIRKPRCCSRRATTRRPRTSDAWRKPVAHLDSRLKSDGFSTHDAKLIGPVSSNVGLLFVLEESCATFASPSPASWPRALSPFSRPRESRAPRRPPAPLRPSLRSLTRERSFRLRFSRPALALRARPRTPRGSQRSASRRRTRRSRRSLPHSRATPSSPLR